MSRVTGRRWAGTPPCGLGSASVASPGKADKHAAGVRQIRRKPCAAEENSWYHKDVNRAIHRVWFGSPQKFGTGSRRMLRAISLLGLAVLFLAISAKLRGGVMGLLVAFVVMLAKYSPLSYVIFGTVVLMAFLIFVSRGSRPR